MDGTLVDFYGVENWLDYLMDEDTYPYEKAKPLCPLNQFARIVNQLQRQSWEINIISWLPRKASYQYGLRVEKAKRDYLKKHLPSVNFNNIFIIPYGSPKSQYGNGILFDDEENNRQEWQGITFSEENLINILKSLKE